MLSIHKLSSEAQLTFVPQRLEIMFGMSLEDLCKPANVHRKGRGGAGGGRNHIKLSKKPLNKATALASLLSCPTWTASMSGQGQVSLNSVPVRCHFRAKTIWKGIPFYVCQRLLQFFLQLHSFTVISFSKYKNTTILIEIYTLVVLVHKKAKYLQNYTV